MRLSLLHLGCDERVVLHTYRHVAHKPVMGLNAAICPRHSPLDMPQNVLQKGMVMRSRLVSCCATLTDRGGVRTWLAGWGGEAVRGACLPRRGLLFPLLLPLPGFFAHVTAALLD